MALDPDVLARLGLDEFIAIDLETTGLHPITDEIIEFGAVQFRNGRPVEGVSQLIRPKQALPPVITTITGITQEELALAPAAASALPQLFDRWTQSTLVAHNLPFDLEFLNAASQQFARQRIAHERCLDTLLLARTFLPSLYSHKLESVTRHFGLSQFQSHRARNDAETTGRLLLCLLEEALRRDRRLLQTLSDAAGPGRTRHLLQALSALAADQPQVEPARTMRDRQAQGAVEPAQLWPQPLAGEEVLAKLRQGGALAGALEHFEERGEQQAMAQSVCNAFNDSHFAVAEAGTGVGKSFAYLLPALAWSQANASPHGRVVLSTRTKTLQDQLFHKDVPRLKQALGARWEVALLKGRQNYVCLRRVDALQRGQLPAHDQDAMLPLLSWLEQTATGDLEEAHGLWSRDLRRWVYDDPEYCVGRRCQFYEQCFSVRAREAAQSAQLVVVNHALLMADLALEGAILGEYRRLIVDEAHHLERSTRQALQRTLSFWTFKSLLEELLRRDELGRELGLLLHLRRLIPAEHSALLEQLDRCSDKVVQLRNDLYGFFERLTGDVQSREPQAETPEYSLRKRYGSEAFAGFSEELVQLQARLEEFTQGVDRLASEAHAALGDSAEEAADALHTAARNVQLQAQTWFWLVRAEDGAYVFWYEISAKPNALVTLSAVPLDVGDALFGLYRHLDTAIFTSATLSIRGDFSYFMARVGLDRLPAEQVRCQDFGQPFKHEEAVHLSIPTYLPDPNDVAFSQALAGLLYDVTTFCEKRTLALFTSYRLLKEVQGQLANRGLFVCAQGPGEPKGRALEAFRKGPKAAVLLGTDSFWEGIDLPGEELEVLVISKLPFPVPTDPLVSAEEERLAELGKSAFAGYSLPQAILALRQGFGRLLRSKSDRGAVILADVRLLRKGYGKQVLAALPCAAKTYFTPSSLLVDLKRFFTE